MLAPCASVTGAATLACWSEQLEKPGALWEPVPLPRAERALPREGRRARTRSRSSPTRRSGARRRTSRTSGTAWLVAVDSSSGDGRPLRRRARHRARAHRGDAAERPDGPHVLRRRAGRQRHASGRRSSSAPTSATRSTTSSRPSRSHGRDRALFSQIKKMTQDAFGSLGNSDQPDTVPLHQAMVRPLERRRPRRPGEREPERRRLPPVPRSAGASRPTTRRSRRRRCRSSRSGSPTRTSLTENIYRNNEAQFMQSLANPEIGGFFDIVQEGAGRREGQDDHRPRARALQRDVARPLDDELHQLERRADVQPRLREHQARRSRPTARSRTCRSASTRRSGRSTSTSAKTRKAAQDNPLYPGGQFTVYGDFCWGGDKTRAEAYFIPAGTKPDRADEQPRPGGRQAGDAAAPGRAHARHGRRRGRRVRDLQRPRRRQGPRRHGRQRGRARSSSTTTRRTARRRSTRRSVLTLKATKKPLSLAAHRRASPGCSSSSFCSSLSSCAAAAEAASGGAAAACAARRPVRRRGTARHPGGYGAPPSGRGLRGAAAGRSAWRRPRRLRA